MNYVSLAVQRSRGGPVDVEHSRDDAVLIHGKPLRRDVPDDHAAPSQHQPHAVHVAEHTAVAQDLPHPGNVADDTTRGADDQVSSRDQAPFERAVYA